MKFVWHPPKREAWIEKWQEARPKGIRGSIRDEHTQRWHDLNEENSHAASQKCMSGGQRGLLIAPGFVQVFEAIERTLIRERGFARDILPIVQCRPKILIAPMRRGRHKIKLLDTKDILPRLLFAESRRALCGGAQDRATECQPGGLKEISRG